MTLLKNLLWSYFVGYLAAATKGFRCPQHSFVAAAISANRIKRGLRIFVQPRFRKRFHSYDPVVQRRRRAGAGMARAMANTRGGTHARDGGAGGGWDCRPPRGGALVRETW